MRKYLVFETFRSKVSPLSEKGGVWGIGNVEEGSAEGSSSASRANLLVVNDLQLAKRGLEVFFLIAVKRNENEQHGGESPEG